VALAFVLAAAVAAGCYNSSTGAANIGDSINFKLPAFPKTGSNAVQIFTEMHYQPSYRTQETPRLLPPPDSVPITGRELRYASLEEYAELTVPDRVTESYDPGNGSALFAINCTVCHGTGLKGDGPIVTFMKRGPFPADLTIDFTRDATDGELFGFISAGGRQGQTLRLRGRRPDSPMPEFQNLLTEDERWTLVLYLRSQIGR
jgi:mono/diheme cytochrome c family protein